MRFIQWSIITICFLALSACSQEQKNSVKKSNIISIQTNSFSNKLFYSGIIQPLRTVVITSPTDGTIVEMPFQYGEEVKNNQLLFMLSSAKFVTEYKTALMQYIKTKNDFNTAQSQLTESEFLHKNQLISDDDFKMKQSNYYAAQLALLQARDGLEILLQQLDVKGVDLYKLTIADIDKINQAMHLQMSAENLRIVSPATGIILSASKNEEENKKISKGDVVKQGDVLAVIGDMNGVSVRIKVNELTVNQLKVGQPVKITGLAFPNDVLAGKIKRVDRQGEASNGGLPTFSAEVQAIHLTKAQQDIIHVGMSAKVEIDINEPAEILVPIAAVRENNGQSFVRVVDENKKTSHEVLVKTGKTTVDSVVILSGLKTGDKILAAN